MKKLVIISDCIHMLSPEGDVVTENHIYCRQMQALAAKFNSTVIVCPFVVFNPARKTSAYSLHSVSFEAVPNAGGSGFKEKMQLLKTIPAWVKAYRKAWNKESVVYLRMPNNISLPAFFYFKSIGAKMFSTYTGTWMHYAKEPFTYRLQRWILKNIFPGPAWVYTAKSTNSKRILPGFSPSFSEAEWQCEQPNIEQRLEKYANTKIMVPVFITVGALVANKNQQYILDTCLRMKKENIPFKWYIAGDGALKDQYTRFVYDNHLESNVVLTGALRYEELQALYRQADAVVQAAIAEGYGKATIEAMNHGAMPILSRTAMAGAITGDGSRGYVFDIDNANSLYSVIKIFLAEQDKWPALVTDARDYVKKLTLENWSSEIERTIRETYFA